MIILIDNVQVIELRGKVGTPHEGYNQALAKENIEAIARNDDDDGVLIVMDTTTTYELLAHETENSNGVVYTDSLVLYNDLIFMINNGGGAVIPLGSWDAVNNVPTLSDGAMYDNGTSVILAPSGSYFTVTVADDDPANNTTIDGVNDWSVGDLVRSNGVVWYRVPNSGAAVTATNVLYNNTKTLFPDYNGNPIDNVQLAIEAADRRGKGPISIHEDVDTTGATNGQALIFNNGILVPGNASGSTLYLVDGKIPVTPTEDGVYLVTEDITTPIVASTNDLLERAAAVWSIIFTASTANVGSAEMQIKNIVGDESNYKWDGVKWSAIDAYEPNAQLLDVNVGNPIGAITAAYKGSDLRGLSISNIIDMMLFPISYTPPSPPTLSITNATTNLERGSDLPNTLGPLTYNQRGGGEINATTLTCLLNGVPQGSESGPAGFEQYLDITDVGGYTPVFPSTANQNMTFDVESAYDEGPIPTDNLGNEYPADRIPAGDVDCNRAYISRYPAWYGSTTEQFKMTASSIDEMTDISIDPNSGTNTSGNTLDESWLRTSWASEHRLITGNYTNVSLVTNDGDRHALIILPPDLTIKNIQELVTGVWTNLIEETHFSSMDITINSIAGDVPRTHKCYYIRHLSKVTLPVRNLRFSTQGTINS